jgi:hypothetical protein
MVNQCEGHTVVVDAWVAHPGIYCKNRQLMDKEVIVIQEALGKDFNLEGCENRAALLKRLAMEIDHLIQADFHRLIAFLYRLDISERKLKQTLEENTDKDAGELIATLIVERQLQKMQTRQSFKPQQDIPEDEKW